MTPNCAAVGSARSRGPATGVVATANSPIAIVQQASGAAARSSSTASAAGAVPVARATWAVASAMPAPNQPAYDGSHMVCSPVSVAPTAMAASHPPVTSRASR